MNLNCLAGGDLLQLIGVFAALGLALLAAGLGMEACAYGWGVARVAAAIEGHARGGVLPPLVEDGPPGVVRLIRALDALRCAHLERAARHLDVQAAYAHDLRTPLSRLGLRCELVEDERLREAMARDLAEMAGLVEASLACARQQRSLPAAPRAAEAHRPQRRSRPTRVRLQLEET